MITLFCTLSQNDRLVSNFSRYSGIPPLTNHVLIRSSVEYGKKSFRWIKSRGETCHCPVLLPYNGLLYPRTSDSMTLTADPDNMSITFSCFRSSSHIFWKIDGMDLLLYIKKGNSSMIITNFSFVTNSWNVLCLNNVSNSDCHPENSIFPKFSSFITLLKRLDKSLMFCLSPSVEARKYIPCLFSRNFNMSSVFPTLLLP